MTVSRRLLTLLAGGLVLSLFLETDFTGRDTSSGLVPQAEARVGRPVTPVSVAGVGRRTVRRCAAGVYNC